MVLWLLCLSRVIQVDTPAPYATVAAGSRYGFSGLPRGHDADIVCGRPPCATPLQVLSKLRVRAVCALPQPASPGVPRACGEGDGCLNRQPEQSADGTLYSRRRHSRLMGMTASMGATAKATAGIKGSLPPLVVPARPKILVMMLAICSKMPWRSAGSVVSK